jgi:hypothetical protein
LSTDEKYAAAYVQPIVIRTDGLEGDTKIMGFFGRISDSYVHSYEFGQDCLSGTAYDTTGSKIRGDVISAVAALSIATTGDVKVHPAGSLSPPLQFSQQGYELVPSDNTAATLQAYGCEGSYMPVEQSRGDSSKLYEKIEDPNFWRPLPETTQ